MPDRQNTLYYGDCLHILREMPAGFVDLIYLDPPFNSSRDYNTIFKNSDGSHPDAQILAFKDTWEWGAQAEREYRELLNTPHAGTLAERLMPTLRSCLGQNDLMAYLVMMGSRLVELKRVLKDTGSLYLHCDPVASHYLKIMLDSLFNPLNFKNEITWKRRRGVMHTTGSHKKYGAITDTILYYTKSDSYTYNQQFTRNDPDYLDYINKFFIYTDSNGRKYCVDNLASPSPRPNLKYEYKGYKPPEKGWAISREKMEQWDKEGRLEFPDNPDGRIRRKRYLDELPGKPVQSLWNDIDPIGSQASERLGYPTQKPLALLERIIETSSNPGDIVLDPFCGCGTAVHAAQKLDRKWIGIDITHLAVTLIKKRMRSAFPTARFRIEGTPKDLESARFLATTNGLEGRYQFQYWALSLIDAMPAQDRKKGSDKGCDGFIWAFSDPQKEPFRINISVKSGKIPSNHIRELGGMLGRDKVEICALLTLEPPTRAMIADALSYGVFQYHGHSFNRLQILTIEDALKGKKIDYLDLGDGKAMPKNARREYSPQKQYPLGGE